MTTSNWLTRVKNHPLFHSFLLYSAFRAVYGIGILVVAYFFATSTDAPWWATLLIFLASMIFSRILFRTLKKISKNENETSLPLE
ncbi:MAG: hypothetical protein DWC00_03125 [Candidatus Poseidoniales archaeon]|nr:MAG: hypothetical protein DWC00_03125 [Candidatus Poseidoniales archaeon]